MHDQYVVETIAIEILNILPLVHILLDQILSLERTEHPKSVHPSKQRVQIVPSYAIKHNYYCI